MKLKILRNLATVMAVILFAAVFAVAAPKSAPVAPTSIESIQMSASPVSPATVAPSVNDWTAANTDRAISNSVCEKSPDEIAVNAEFNDNQIIGRHSETNELMTIIPPNISQSAFSPRANSYLIKPAPKLIVNGVNDQRFHRRE